MRLSAPSPRTSVRGDLLPKSPLFRMAAGCFALCGTEARPRGPGCGRCPDTGGSANGGSRVESAARRKGAPAPVPGSPAEPGDSQGGARPERAARPVGCANRRPPPWACLWVLSARAESTPPEAKGENSPKYPGSPQIFRQQNGLVFSNEIEYNMGSE